MRRVFNSVIFLMITLIAASLVCGASHAAAKDANMVFILDASGSMWGQVDGKAKMGIAKEVMAGLIDDLPEGMNVGLVAYGHRKKGDCNDVEEIVALAPVKKSVLKSKVNAISPKGKTPITLSITKTVKPLKTREGETTIVLVSDGKETCEGDPCQLVKELKASGVKFTMHVVGFDVTAEETKQLECIAKAGGGEYFAAKNASDFKKAAEEVVEKANPTGELRVTAVRNGKSIPGRIEVFKSGAKERVVLNNTVQIKTDAGTDLMPGTYDVKVIDSKTAGKPSVTLKGIAIERGAVVEKSADFSGGKVALGVTRNGEKVTGTIYVTDPVTSKRVAHHDSSVDNPKTINLQPGTYDIKVIYGGLPGDPFVEYKGVVVDNGTLFERTADFSEGKLHVGATSNGKKVTGGIYVHDAVTGKRVATGDTSAHNPVPISLQPGTYDVKIKYGELPGDPVKEFKGVVIARGGSVEKSVDFSEGYIEVTTLMNGEKGYTRYGRKAFGSYKILDPVTGKRIATGDTSADNPDRTIVAPGTYTIIVRSERVAGKPTVKFENVVVLQGATVSKTADFKCGHMEVGINKGGEKAKGSIYIYEAGTEKRVDSGDTSADNPDRYTLLPGKYDVVVKYKKGEEPEEKKFEGVVVDAAATKTVAAAF